MGEAQACGHGPADGGEDPLGRQKNRRVDIVIGTCS
jgi:hypothetical protein